MQRRSGPTQVLLGLIEATERHGGVLARLPVTHWPVTVGRDLHSDLLLDDVHVAARHLRLSPGAPGIVRVEVLDTSNGVSLGHTQHRRGDLFDWPAGQLLMLGRLQLRLRLAGTPVSDEQPLPRLRWRTAAGTLGAVGLVLLMMLAQVWLTIGETQNIPQQLPLC